MWEFKTSSCKRKRNVSSAGDNGIWGGANIWMIQQVEVNLPALGGTSRKTYGVENYIENLCATKRDILCLT